MQQSRTITRTDLRYLFEKAANSYPWLLHKGALAPDVANLFDAIAELEGSLGGGSVRATIDEAIAEAREAEDPDAQE